ncbi:MAG: hypothetical protein AAFW75_26960 [Cyanobacteria bacterium J06636_16]
MAKFSRQSVEAFQSELEKIDESWQTEFNLRETVSQSFSQITRARKLKVSWEQIAAILMEASASDEKISAESIRQYYFELTKHPEILEKSRRKSKSCKAKAKSSTVKKTEPRMSVESSKKADDSADKKISLQTEDVASQFNLGRLK